MATVIELLDQALEQIAEKADAAGHSAPGREYALARTAIEDAQMRYTRGRAMDLGRFHPADLDLGVG